MIWKSSNVLFYQAGIASFGTSIPHTSAMMKAKRHFWYEAKGFKVMAQEKQDTSLSVGRAFERIWKNI